MNSPPTAEDALVRIIAHMASATGRGSGVRTGIGDDAAVLETVGGRLLLATTDLLVEDVHFRRRWAGPADIGWKSIAVNLSDIAAMGGVPRWGLVALGCPGDVGEAEIRAFYDGALACASEHDVAVVGGDTSASPAGWLVNVTLLGESAHRPLLRSTAHPGDVIAVTGVLGRSGAGLAALELESVPARVPPATFAALTSTHLRPRPRVHEGRWLGRDGSASAMMDVSDGLASDLPRLCVASEVGARVELRRLPVDEATRTLGAALDADPVGWATGGGEDYELLLTCPPDVFARLARGLEEATGTPLTAVGEVVPGAGVTWLDAAGRSVAVTPGWEHFVGRAAAGARR